MMIEGQEPTGAVAIRPCRAEECEAVLTLWRRAGAIPSPTDTLEELLRLVRSEHGDGFPVPVPAPLAPPHRSASRSFVPPTSAPPAPAPALVFATLALVLPGLAPILRMSTP